MPSCVVLLNKEPQFNFVVLLCLFLVCCCVDGCRKFNVYPINGIFVIITIRVFVLVGQITDLHSRFEALFV